MTAQSSWRGSAMLLAGLLIGWQLLYLAIGDIAMRSPWQTVSHLAELFRTPRFWPHLTESARAFGIAMLIATLAGLAIGFLLGASRFAAAAFEPVLVALYSIPKVTLYPIVLLAFGLGMPAKIAFGAIHGVIPIALFTINGVRNVRPVLLKTGRVLRLTRLQLVRRILLPAALPEIFSGLRIGFALTLIGTVLGEMFASQRGLGSLLMSAIGLHDVDSIMAVTLLMVGFAATVSSVLLAVDRRLRRRE
jgi:NitT/TauT family transport system permease protein